MVDKGSFADGHFRLGQKVRLLPLGADQLFTLVGVMEYKTADQEAQRSVALSQTGAALDAAVATGSPAGRRMLTAQGRPTSFGVTGREGMTAWTTPASTMR